MACCSGVNTCSCVVQGDGITAAVSGVGSTASPYVVTALIPAATPTPVTPGTGIGVTGLGTLVSPYVITNTAPSKPVTVVNPAAASILAAPGVNLTGAVSSYLAIVGFIQYFPFFVDGASLTFDRAECIITATSTNLFRLGIYNADASWQPTTLVEDFGTAPCNGALTAFTPAASTRTLPAGRYVWAMSASGTPTFRAWTGWVSGGLILGTLASNAGVDSFAVAAPFAAYPSPGTAWTTASGTVSVGVNPFLLRLTATA